MRYMRTRLGRDAPDIGRSVRVGRWRRVRRRRCGSLGLRHADALAVWGTEAPPGGGGYFPTGTLTWTSAAP